MPAPAPDRFSVFCCDATLGLLVVLGALYFLLRAFRKDQDRTGPQDSDED